MKSSPTYFFGLLLLLLFTACPADRELAPAFVLVEDFRLETPGLGAATEDITEVWAFADDSFIGAFPLPARIPVPRAGATTLRLEAGVRQNGISTTPEIYEFYTPVNRNLELVPGETIDLGVLEINYRADVQFAVFENFEPGIPRAFSDQIVGTAPLEVSAERIRSGEFSGRLALDLDNPLVEIATQERLSGLTDERPYVWLELDYSSEVPVVWGITGNQGIETIRVFDPGFNPRAGWTKIYFNLSEIIVRSTLEEYQLIFSALLPPGEEAGTLYL
ncbi:MAG: hypothetical protein AAGA62_08690, partial [Bacteroidota bacterium]